MQVSRPGCFGKMPRHGDFVRHNAEAFAFAGLDRWLLEGLAAPPRAGSAELRAAHFVFLRDTAAICGVLVPSVDRVGRRFPIAVFVVIADVAGLDFLAPILAAGFLRAANDVADLAARGSVDLSGLRNHVDSLRGLSDEAASRQRLDEYARATTLRAFAREVLGDGDEGVAGTWLSNLWAAVGGHERPRYAVRSVAIDQPEWLAAWLRLAALGAGRRSPRLLLWDRVGAAGIGQSRLLYDEIGSRYATALLYPTVGSDLAYDVTPVTVSMSAPAAAGLLRDDVSLASVFAQSAS